MAPDKTSDPSASSPSSGSAGSTSPPSRGASSSSRGGYGRGRGVPRNRPNTIGSDIPPHTADTQSETPREKNAEERVANAVTTTATASSADTKGTEDSAKRTTNGRPLSAPSSKGPKRAHSAGLTDGKAPATPVPASPAVSTPASAVQVHLPSESSKSIERILLLSDLNGKLSLINQLVQKTNATSVIVAGSFGFFDKESTSRLSEEFLQNMVQASSHISAKDKATATGLSGASLRDFASQHLTLSELPKYLAGSEKFDVPVFVIPGKHEDLRVVEGFLSMQHKAHNLNLLGEHITFTVAAMRLFGLGGAFIKHQLFNVGQGQQNVAGDLAGNMWTTMLQVGELVTKADVLPLSSRLLVTHPSAQSEFSMLQLAAAVKANILVTAGATSYVNVFESSMISSKDPRVQASQEEIKWLWDQVKEQVEHLQQEQQGAMIKKALQAFEKSHESGSPSTLVITLPPASEGYAVLQLDRKLSLETFSTGKQMGGHKRPSQPTVAPISVASPAPASTSAATPMEKKQETHQQEEDQKRGKRLQKEHIREDARRPSAASLFPTEPPFKAFLRNLPPDATEEEVRSLFDGFQIVELKTSHPNYVQFADLDSLKRAVELTNKSIRNRVIRVAVFRDIPPSSLAAPPRRRESEGPAPARANGPSSSRPSSAAPSPSTSSAPSRGPRREPRTSASQAKSGSTPTTAEPPAATPTPAAL